MFVTALAIQALAATAALAMPPSAEHAVREDMSRRDVTLSTDWSGAVLNGPAVRPSTPSSPHTC